MVRVFVGILGQNIYVIFQIDVNCRYLRRLPTVATNEGDGRLRAVCRGFIREVILRTARHFDIHILSAMAGVVYATEDVDDNYTFAQQDFPLFAMYVTDILRDSPLRTLCGMRCMRFYVYYHGLRLSKSQGKRVMYDIANMDHEYVDVVQMHRADVATSTQRHQLAVKLSGTGEDSLRDMYYVGINMDCKTERYRIGFIYDFSFYSRYGSPLHMGDHDVTFAQAHNPVAKMAHPRDSGYVASYAICRGYADKDTVIRKASENRHMYVENMLFYIENYVRGTPRLRIEEVVTIDRTCSLYTSLKLAELGIFHPTSMCLTTIQLIRKGLILRLGNWQCYVDTFIGPDLAILRSVLNTEENTCAWIPPACISTIVRADFCVMYFVYGRCPFYNYKVTQHMLLNRSEGQSVEDGQIHLRPLHDDSDLYPLYSNKLNSSMMTAIRFIWHVQNYISRNEDEEMN